MSRESLTAEKRDASGKSPVARRLRKQGRVPGVLYTSEGGVAISADELELAAVVRHGAQMVDLSLDGNKYISILKEYQVHPVRGTLMHVDFQEVRLDQSIKISVPIHIFGESPGVKAGGVLTQNIHELQVECKASDIPDHIDVDISGLEPGASMHLSELTPPVNSVFLDPEDMLLMSINMPRGARAGSDDDGDGEAAEGEGGGEEAAADAPASSD